jgi:hypothetical protein
VADPIEYTIITHPNDPERSETYTERASSPTAAAFRWADHVAEADDEWEEDVIVCGPDGCVSVHVSARYVLEIDTGPSKPAEDPRPAIAAALAALSADTEPPEDAWFEDNMAPLHGGAPAWRWATDGHCLIRDDAPRPATMRACDGRLMAWFRGDQCPAADTVRSLTAAHSVDWLHKGIRVDPRFLPILQAGDEFAAPELGPPVHVYRGGTLIAVVMPMQPGSEAGVLLSEVTDV